MTFMPPFGDLTPPSMISTLVGVFGPGNTSYFLNILTSVNLSSCNANFMPMQLRGPMPKPMKAIGFLLYSGEWRNGSNFFGSCGPQISFSFHFIKKSSWYNKKKQIRKKINLEYTSLKWTDKTSTAIDMSTGMSIPFTVVALVQRRVTALLINELIFFYINLN